MRTEGGCTPRQTLITGPKFRFSTSYGSGFINIAKYLHVREIFISYLISTRKVLKKTFKLNVCSQISPNILSKIVIETP